MSGLPATLDAGQIGALAAFLTRHAEAYRSNARRVDEIRTNVAGWWVGDAADAFKGHSTDRSAALNAIADATSQVATAASTFAAQIANDVPAYRQADARADQAWAADEYLDALSWAWERGKIHRRLEAAARDFCSAVNDRFADAPWYAELFDDDDDLDSLAADRDDHRDDVDRYLVQRSASAVLNGYVDGTPDRIPAPISASGNPLSTEEWQRRFGISIPYRVLNFSFGAGRGGTMKMLPGGAVEIEIDRSVFGAVDVEGGDASAGVEGVDSQVQRLVLPTPELAAEFRRRLERMYSHENRVILGSIPGPRSGLLADTGAINDMLTEQQQLEDQFGRYRETTLHRTTITPRAKLDTPFADLEGSYSIGQEVDTRTNQTTQVTRIQGELRGTTELFTGGGEVDIEVRRVMAGDTLNKVEVTVTGFGRAGVAAETDVLRRIGADNIPRVGDALDAVSARTEATAGLYGRYRYTIDAATPEARRLAEGFADLHEGGGVRAVGDVVNGSGNVRVQYEVGRFTGTKTDIDALVLYQDSRRNYEVLGATDVTTVWGRR